MGQSNKEIRTKGGFVPEVGQVMDGDLPEASMGSNCSLGSAKGSSSQPRDCVPKLRSQKMLS